MLQAILQYITGRLQVLFPDFKIHELAEIITSVDGDDEKSTFPAIYCNGEHEAIDLEDGKGVIYFRKNGDVRVEELEEDESTTDTYEARTFPLRMVLFAPKDYYKTDNAFAQGKIAENVKKAVASYANKALRQELKASNIFIDIKSWNDDALKVAGQEVTGNAQWDIDYKNTLIAFELEIRIEGTNECFDYWGCLDEAAEIVFCDPVTIKNHEDVTILTPASGSVVTTQTILEALGADGIIVDLEAIGDPILSDVREGISYYFEHTAHFTGIAKPTYLRVKAAGYTLDPTLVNISAATYKKINTSGTSVYSIGGALAEGDYIEITPTAADTGQVSSITIRGIYTTTTASASLPSNAPSTHLCITNRYSNTLSIIQEDIITGNAYNSGGAWPVNPVVSTISMPTSFAPTCVHYRHVNKSWYAFGLNRVSRIDADPNSATFLNVYDLSGTQNAATTLTIFVSQQFQSVDYDYINDLYCVTAGTSTNGVHIFNPITGVAQTILTRSGFDLTLINYVKFIPHAQSFLLTGLNGDQYLYDHINNKLSYGFRKTSGQVLFVPENGRFYISEVTGGVSIRNTNLTQVSAVSPTSYAVGSMAYSQSNNKIIGGASLASNNFLWVIDTLTNTGGTRITKASIDTGEVNTSSVFYSNGRVYAMSGGSSPSSGNSRVHVLDPSQSGNASYLGYFTVGNFSNGWEYLTQITNNSHV